MLEHELHIFRNIVKGMTEGIISLSMNGRVTTVNPAVLEILNKTEEELIGKPFASLFFDDQRNDAFNQAVLDAIYEDATAHNATVDFFEGEIAKKLFMNTSFIKNGDEKIGVAVVLNDITKLVELQDAVRAMEQIQALNNELQKRNAFIKKTFGRYLSDDIVNTILEEKDGLVIGGKKQEVTIMFTDIRGFTAISESMKPDDLIKMLNHYLGDMITIVQKHRGTILEFIGDAIVVVFGAPLQSETRDLDAVNCAIEMQCAMAQVNEYNASKDYPDIEMGIGIHTGEAILGNIGSEQKAKYDIIGKNVNLASRIETYTVGGQILISPITRERVGEQLITTGELEILPKGLATPITIYDVGACGEYKMPDKTQHFVELETPMAIEVQIIEGKFASEEKLACEIYSVSEKQAQMRTPIALEKNKNIKFRVGEDEVYAKVYVPGETQVTIHLTKGKIN